MLGCRPPFRRCYYQQHPPSSDYSCSISPPAKLEPTGGDSMEDLKAALSEHVDLVSDIFQNISSELRTGFAPAYQSLLGFFHAIDWSESWLICLIVCHVTLLLTVLISRRNVNFQLCLSVLTFAGVFLAERLNRFLGAHWKSFAGQNYFDSNGIFISVLWSGPLLLITMVMLVNILFTLCQLIIKWKRAELRHRARLSRGKQE